ncbi:hypothetical protein Dimus_008216, partial [Dionaea muscipula]
HPASITWPRAKSAAAAQASHRGEEEVPAAQSKHAVAPSRCRRRSLAISQIGRLHQRPRSPPSTPRTATDKPDPSRRPAFADHLCSDLHQPPPRATTPPDLLFSQIHIAASRRPEQPPPGNNSLRASNHLLHHHPTSASPSPVSVVVNSLGWVNS